MKTSTKQLRKLLGLSSLTTQRVNVKNSIGETCFNAVAVFANFDVRSTRNPGEIMKFIGESLAYSDDKEFVVNAIRQAGFNCTITTFPRSSRLQLLVEVSNYEINGKLDSALRPLSAFSLDFSGMALNNLRLN